MVAPILEHEHKEQDICGQRVCGICYEKELLNTPIKGDSRNIPELEQYYNPTAHRMMVRKKK